MRIVAGLILAGAGALLVGSPSRAPVAVLLSLGTTALPLTRAWRGADGTALKPAIVWAALTVALGIVSQAFALNEPLGSGRPAAGHVGYIMVLTALAALISVLNARTPGGGAWAILMVILVLIFLIPWLEGPGLVRRAQGSERLHLDAPWTIFYGLVVVAGITNYLPTRYGPAALCAGVGLVLEYLALTRLSWLPQTKALVWSAVPWSFALAIWVAAFRSRGEPSAEPGLGRAWVWFRDHWGVVWALRVKERFNRTAEVQRWPIRLGWFGIIPAPGTEPTSASAFPQAAEATFRSLLRRFAQPDRVERAEGRVEAATCEAKGTR
jgi:hypothetical protein